MFAFSLCEEVANRLKEGQVLLPREIAELSIADTFQQCYQTALRFLSYRPRSTSEVKNRLLRKQFTPETIAQAIRQLKERNLLNDNDFARFWMRNRDTHSPRSQRMIQTELKLKGVSSEVALVATRDIDEVDAARRAAAKKARVLNGLAQDTFRKKLSFFLIRRGFGWETTKRVVEEMIVSIKLDKHN